MRTMLQKTSSCSFATGDLASSPLETTLCAPPARCEYVVQSGLNHIQSGTNGNVEKSTSQISFYIVAFEVSALSMEATLHPRSAKALETTPCPLQPMSRVRE